MCLDCSSSPEDDCQQIPASEDIPEQVAASETRFSEKAPSAELLDETQLKSKLRESNLVEKMDTQPHSPDLFGDKKVSDNSEGQAASSSDSDRSNSDSDSDSGSDSDGSGSDSGSHSRSKSRSPVGSRSGSSSDSESDASSNSKQGSDIEVDIMTSDDEKEQNHKLPPSQTLFPTSSSPWRTPDGRSVRNGIDAKTDGHGSNAVEIEKDQIDGDQETELANLVPNKEDRKSGEGFKPILSDCDGHQERQAHTGNLFSERESMFKDGFKREQSDSSEGISKGKSRKLSDAKRGDYKSDRMKKLKTGNMSQQPISAVRNTYFSDIAQNESPDRLIEGHNRAPVSQTTRADRDGNADFGSQKGYAPIPGRSVPDSHQSVRRPVDRNARAKIPDTAEKPSKYADNLEHGFKYSESSFQTNEGFPMHKDKLYRETQDEDGYANEKKQRNTKDGSFGDKYSFDTHERKHEMIGKSKEVGQVSNSYMGSSPRDSSRFVVDRSLMENGRSMILRRELSDLELGELREPLPEETPGIKKQFERKSSFKQSETKPNTSDNWNFDVNRGRHAGKVSLDSGKLSPSHLGVGVSGNPEASSKKKTKEHNVEDIARPHHRIGQSQPPQISRVDNAEVGSQFNKLTDVNGKYRYNEDSTNQGMGPEDYGETHKRMPVSVLQHDAKHGLASHSTRESKMQKSDMVPDSSDKQKDAFFANSSNNGLRRESSSDENSCSYSKYEKEKPELKGPIKDFSQ